jgi:hypothetical protein
MQPASMLLAGLALWVAIVIFTVTHALFTGTIRMGVSGSSLIHRAEEPDRFWRAFALSTGGLVVALLMTCGIVKMAAPAAWEDAKHQLVGKSRG